MKIEAHIRNLLARYGRVSISRRGVFRCVSEGARVESGKMLPPVAKVVFEPSESAEMDRMLVEAVMRDYEIEWNEACEYIYNVSVNIDEVTRRWDYLPQNYGLKPVDMPQIRIMPVKWLDVKYAAVVAVAAMLNIFVPFNSVNTDLNEAGIALSTMQKVVVPVAESEAVEEEEIIVEEMHYIIVVASFETQEAAMRCITDGRTPGAMEVIEKDGRCRVCGMRFVTYEEANNYIRENSLKAWVMKI